MFPNLGKEGNVADAASSGRGSVTGTTAFQPPQMPSSWTATRRLTALALLVFLAAPLAAAGLGAEPIEIEATALPLNPEDRDQRTVGRLSYLGGLKLTSDDSRFGGLSGLVVDADGGRLTAVSDRGFWFSARLVSDNDGAPRALVGAALAPLLGPDGKPVAGRRRDAEAVELAPGGGYIVSFERAHRLWRYGGGGELGDARPAPVETPPALELAPANGGIEALAVLGPGRLLALTEDLRTRDGDLVGWLIEEGGVSELTYATRHRFRPTDLAVLPDGDLLALERRYSVIAGAGARLVRIARQSIRPGARLEGEEIARLVPPLTVDNMEGLAVRAAPDGGALVYMLSDDNYNPFQATLLMVFRLEE